MWSCDRGNSRSSGPIVDVLNGDYPEADVKTLSVTGLEKLVAGLVQCTASVVGANQTNRPKWWPNGLVFKHTSKLGLDDEALKQLIASCSQFFKRMRWVSEWNEENRKRKRMETLAPQKRLRVILPPIPPPKEQFLSYFKLGCNPVKSDRTDNIPVPPTTSKFTNCLHIPISSDVGRIMAAKEQHHMPDDLKMKRLEKTEWYVNKPTPTLKVEEVDYEQTRPCKNNANAHMYKVPKRQQCQQRPSFYDAEFLARFCNPLLVNVERLDLEKLKTRTPSLVVKLDRVDLKKLKCAKEKKTKKKLLVLVKKSEKLNCDVKISRRILRTSPRLRNV